MSQQNAHIQELRDKRDIDGLMALLQHPEAAMRRAAVRALGELGDVRAVEALTAALKDEDREVGKAAAGALRQIVILTVNPLVQAIESKQEICEAANDVIRCFGTSKRIALLTTMLVAWTKRCVVLGGQVTDPYSLTWISDAYSNENRAIRGAVAAAYALGVIGAEDAVPELKSALRDGDSNVRQAAAWALEMIGWKPGADENAGWYWMARREWAKCAALGSPALEPLRAALRDEDKRVREAAAEALVELGAPALEPFIAALTDKDERVRQAAAQVLASLGISSAVEPLIAALRDEDEDVREAAAGALGKLGDARAVEPLIAALKDEKRWVRRAAAEALGKLGWRPGADENAAWYWMAKQDWEKCVALGAPAVEPLIAALVDKEWGVREAAAEALGKLGDPRAVEPLIAALVDKEWGVRKAAAEALGKLGDPRAVEPLIATLKDKSGDVRKAAAGALGKIGGDRAVEALIAVLRGKYVHGLLLQKLDKMRVEEARQVAAFLKTWDEESVPLHLLIRQALAEDTHPFVVHLLSTTLAEEKDVLGSVAQALGQIGDPRAVEPLLVILKHDLGVGYQAAAALWQLGCTQELARLLKEGTVQTRREIVVGLASTRDPRAVPLIVTALEDEDNDVRDEAAYSLSRLRHPAAVEALTVVLEKDEDSTVRWRAAMALGKIGDQRAVEALIAALRDPDSEVRSTAAWALGKIGAERAVNHLVAMLGDVSSFVRKSVACALDDLGWQAEPGEQTAWYWAAKKDWQRCVALGKLAVEPLLFALQDLQTAKEAASALEAIGWKPALDENAAWYWAAKEDWEQCIALGGTAVQPLITMLLKEKSLQRRQSIASALVKLYRALPLSERTPILAVKENIIHIHQDVGGRRIEGSPWGCVAPHTDLNLGVEFPL